jgi:BirA family biotin operon repressor/biotin-[acetyl-CoA-carboxylase] ligase
MKVWYFTEVESTNDVAAALVAEGAPHGALVVADAQTRGRGRQGHTWFSPPGAGLYFSLLFRPGPIDPATVGLLTLAAGVAIAEAVERVCGVSAELKWPNDLVIRRSGEPGGRRKLAGILAEAALVGTCVEHVVLGIGVNLCDSAYPPELADRVTSLAREAGAPVDRFDLLAECLAAVQERWTNLVAGDAAVVLQEWRRRSPSAVGAPVLVQRGGTMRPGITAGLLGDGALQVDAGGETVRVVAGEVQWQ